MEDRIVAFLVNFHGKYKTLIFCLYESWIWWVILTVAVLVKFLFWPLLLLCAIMLIVSYRKKNKKRKNAPESVDNTE